jgi:hypothetical protein
MVLRRAWLIGMAVCLAGYAVAQESAPVQPATPVPAKPAAAPANANPIPAAKLEESPSAGATEQAAAESPSQALAEGTLDADKIMAAQKAGYTIKNENGQQLLCRKELQTGSRLRHKTSCLTARQWEQLQNDTNLQLKSMERKPMVVERR